jgi:hypothetical protein
MSKFSGSNVQRHGRVNAIFMPDPDPQQRNQLKERLRLRQGGISLQNPPISIPHLSVNSSLGEKAPDAKIRTYDIANAKELKRRADCELFKRGRHIAEELFQGPSANADSKTRELFRRGMRIAEEQMQGTSVNAKSKTPREKAIECRTKAELIRKNATDLQLLSKNANIHHEKLIAESQRLNKLAYEAEQTHQNFIAKQQAIAAAKFNKRRRQGIAATKSTYDTESDDDVSITSID